MRKIYQKPEAELIVITAMETIADDEYENPDTSGGHDDFDPWA